MSRPNTPSRKPRAIQAILLPVVMPRSASGRRLGAYGLLGSVESPAGTVPSWPDQADRASIPAAGRLPLRTRHHRAPPFPHVRRRRGSGASAARAADCGGCRPLGALRRPAIGWRRSLPCRVLVFACRGVARVAHTRLLFLGFVSPHCTSTVRTCPIWFTRR